MPSVTSNGVAVAILAAGESSRMGFPKALLAYRGTTFLEWLGGLYTEARLDPLLVVLGHEHERIRAGVKLPERAQVLLNAEYKLGQLSSLQVAIRYLARLGDETAAERGGRPRSISGLLVSPVDHPCVSPEVLNALLLAFAAEHPDIVIPTFDGRRGHPVIFSSRLFPELLEAPLDQGARAVVRQHAVCEVSVADGGVLADIDNPELYRRWIAPADPRER